MNSFIIYTDGGARGNPGPAGVGIVLQPIIKSLSQEFIYLKKYIGETTNNVAEYSAVILGLEEALKIGAEEVELRLDSELVGKQLRGEYKVKDLNMQKLFVQAWNLKMKLKKFHVTIIRREANQEADRLVNEALDERHITRIT